MKKLYIYINMLKQSLLNYVGCVGVVGPWVRGSVGLVGSWVRGPREFVGIVGPKGTWVRGSKMYVGVVGSWVQKIFTWVRGSNFSRGFVGLVGPIFYVGSWVSWVLFVNF